MELIIIIRKIEFSYRYVKVEYQSEKEAVKIFNKMNDWDIVEIHDNTLTYRYEKPNHLFLQLKEFLIWSSGESYSYKRHLVDTTGKIITYLDLVVENGYLFQVSLERTNKYGERHFVSSFGIWQFGRMLSIHDNDTIHFSDENPITVTLKNSNLDGHINMIEYDERNIVTIKMMKVEEI